MKTRMIIAAVLILSICSGCNYIDIDKRYFVIAMGLDKNADTKAYDLYLKIALPSGEPHKKADTYFLDTKDITSLNQGVENIKQIAEKELDFSHMNTVLFGKNIKKKDIDMFIDWLVQNSDIQNTTHLALAEPSAFKVLNNDTSEKQYAPLSLNIMLSQLSASTPYLVSNNLFEFRRNETEEGIDPVLPLVEKYGNKLRIRKAVIFDKQNGTFNLNSEQLKTFNMLQGDIKKDSFKVTDSKGCFYIKYDSLSTKLKLETDDFPGILKVNMKMEGDVVQSVEGYNNMKLKSYEKLSEQMLQKQVDELLSIFQEKRIDPLGLGLKYRSSHFGSVEEEKKKWESIYPHLDFDVQTQVKLLSPGTLK